MEEKISKSNNSRVRLHYQLHEIDMFFSLHYVVVIQNLITSIVLKNEELGQSKKEV